MLALQRDEPPERHDYLSIASAVRTELAAIIPALTTHFDTASLALGDAVTNIDQIVKALQDVASVFDTGEAASAVEDLMDAAEDLRTVKAQADARALTIAEIRSSSVTLRSCAGDILRCIQVLDVYGMNVKITASGAAEFMDFADRMRAKLYAASGEVQSLDYTLELLESSLREMGRNDALLVHECAKVVPQIPDRLMRDAEALKKHQAGLVRLAQSTNTVAQAIRAELGLALGAIQIGDRVRQRLEHVMFGCELVENVATSGGTEPATADALHNHLLPLLGALTSAAAAEFGTEAQALLTSLRRLKENAGQLTALKGPERDERGQGFLALLKGGIADAEGMIAQLSQADRQGAATLEQILTTVDDVAAKMAAITELRLEVRNMAINIGLSCRNMGQLGKPITVIANEIRSYSDRLDLIVSTISRAEATLIKTSSQMNGKRANGETSAGQLSQFLEVIHTCDDRSLTGLGVVDANAGGVHLSLREAIANLEELIEKMENLVAISSLMNIDTSDDDLSSDDYSQEFIDMLSAMSKKYTMKGERDIHSAYIPNCFLGTSCNEAEDIPDSDDDDDGLF